jgi:hypothetical protein
MGKRLERARKHGGKILIRGRRRRLWKKLERRRGSLGGYSLDQQSD